MSVAERAAQSQLRTAGGAPWLLLPAGGHTGFWSDDGGVTWETLDLPALGETPRSLDVGANGAAVVVSVDRGGLLIERSPDRGAGWVTAARPVPPGDGHIARVAVRASGDTWIAAWTSEDGRTSSQGGSTTTGSAVYVSRSIDGGISWSRPALVAEESLGQAGLALAADGAGKWVLAWADENLSVVRSDDNGLTWTRRQTVARQVACTGCRRGRFHTRIGLASDGGLWMIAFSSPNYRTRRFGADGDIFVVRSTDGAATWSAPVAIAPYARRDGAREINPSLAAADGRWWAVWTSHRPVSSDDILDADVVVSVSSDGGSTWSPPLPVDPALSTDTAADGGAVVAAPGRRAAMMAWSARELTPSASRPNERILVANAGAQRGNGRIEAGEACDDAGRTDGDGCDSNCTPTGCGNGIVTAGEECDDGNRNWNDACLNDCRAAVCGDGFLRDGVEECDDGNDDPTDSCTDACRWARCGDGRVWRHHEACDDGNDVDDDECPNDCGRAVCGDGVTSIGFEECDWADPNYARDCTRECFLTDVCGDADGNGIVAASDAQRILLGAVGTGLDCPPAACDMDANGALGVRDAHMALGKAVGLAVGDHCSIGSGTIVFWTPDVREIVALQIEVSYGDTGGAFSGSGARVACETLAPVYASAYNDDEKTKVLNAGFIGLDLYSSADRGEGQPVDVFRCAFELPDDRSGVRFEVRTVDASSPELVPLIPPPHFGYRLE